MDLQQFSVLCLYTDVQLVVVVVVIGFWRTLKLSMFTSLVEFLDEVG